MQDATAISRNLMLVCDLKKKKTETINKCIKDIIFLLPNRKRRLLIREKEIFRDIDIYTS